MGGGRQAAKLEVVRDDGRFGLAVMFGYEQRRAVEILDLDLVQVHNVDVAEESEAREEVGARRAHRSGAHHKHV